MIHFATCIMWQPTERLASLSLKIQKKPLTHWVKLPHMLQFNLDLSSTRIFSLFWLWEIWQGLFDGTGQVQLWLRPFSTIKVPSSSISSDIILRHHPRCVALTNLYQTQCQRKKNVARWVLALGNDIPLVKLEIPSTGGCAPQYFITTTPRAAVYLPPGRATHGFWAYDISQVAICFLKDSWRVDLPDIQAKGFTYEALKNAKVRNVPKSIVYGDISTTKYHATKMLTYAKETWACGDFDHLIPHWHYHLVLNVVGRSLLAFDSSHEMVAAVCDAIVGRFNRPFADE